MHIPHFTHPDGDLGCFHLLVIVNQTALDMGVQVSVWSPAFSSFEDVLKSGMDGTTSPWIHFS